MRALARELLERADNCSWLQYQSNAQDTDRLTQARYYRAAALLLLDQPQEAISGLVTVSGATDWRWSLKMQQRIHRLTSESILLG